jgi:hypothetical protein
MLVVQMVIVPLWRLFLDLWGRTPLILDLREALRVRSCLQLRACGQTHLDAKCIQSIRYCDCAKRLSRCSVSL